MRNLLKLTNKIGFAQQQHLRQIDNAISLKIQQTPLLDQQLRSRLLQIQKFQSNKLPYYFKNNLINQDSTLYQISGNSFFDSFYAAYCLHGDVMISPSDIWLAVGHKFARKVLSDSQKYRQFFVSHEGKMNLKFTVDPSSQDWKDFPSNKNRWDKAIDHYFNLVTKNVKSDIGLIMKNDFSCSNHIEQVSSQMIFLSSMRDYFRYQMSLICGIQNVHFVGKIEDYENLYKKIESLMTKFPQFNAQEILEVIDKFIFQMKNPDQVDVHFWNNIFQYKEKNLTGIQGCGGQEYKKQVFDGWFKHFFEDINTIQYYDLEWTQDKREFRVPSFYSQYEVEFNNFGFMHKLTFETGMKGIEEVLPNTFKPNIYIQIY